MGLDKKDIQMMAVSIPTVDYWDMKEELDKLSDCVNRLEKVVEILVALYHEERVKNWELILQEMLKREEGKKRRMIKPMFRTDFESDEALLERSGDFL